MRNSLLERVESFKIFGKLYEKKFFDIFCGRGVSHTPSDKVGVCDNALGQSGRIAYALGQSGRMRYAPTAENVNNPLKDKPQQLQ